MALPDGGPGLQIAFPAAVHWRVADRQRHRLRGPELHGVILSGLSGQGVYLFSACPVRGAGDHVVAREQRRQPTGVGTIGGRPAWMSPSSRAYLPTRPNQYTASAPHPPPDARRPTQAPHGAAEPD